MFKNILKKLLLAFLVIAPLLASADDPRTAYLNEYGTPSFVSKAGNNMTLGLGSTGILKLKTATGTLQVTDSNPAEGTAATTVASSGTIDTTQFWQRVTDAGAITGVIMEAGTVHGQLVLLSVDKDASGTVTMAAESTSNACAGTGVVLAAGESALFVWDATDTCWAGFQS